jgi:hypothetical protein
MINLTAGDPRVKIEQLETEIIELRRELWDQWFFTHSEHCQNEWPHEGRCQWPLPKTLGIRIQERGP